MSRETKKKEDKEQKKDKKENTKGEGTPEGSKA